MEDKDNNRLFGKLCYLHRQMCRENSQLFSEYGITPVQMHTLTYIEKATSEGKKVFQKDIERRINLRPSSISTLISHLERDGFLKRTVSDGDARAKSVELTEKGRYVCIKDKLLMDKCDSAIQAALTQDEQEQFLRLLTKILASITEKTEIK